MTKTLLHHFRSFSLRTHLLLMAFVLALPAVVLIIHSGLDQRAYSLLEGTSKTKQLANDIAYEQINLAAAAQQLAMVLAQLPQVQEHRGDEVDRILAKVLALNPRYGNIVITDQLGDVWASGLPLTQPFSLGTVRTFQNAMKTGQFSSGEFVVGKISSIPTIGFGYPITGVNGERVGVIALNFNFGHFNEMLKQAGLPAGTIFTLADYNGIIINRNREPERFIGKKLNDDIFMSMVSGPAEGTAIGFEAGDVKQVIAYRKVRLADEQHPYLYIRVGVPLQATMKIAVHDQVVDMLFLSSFLLLALLLALLIGKYSLIDRINVLRGASQHMADGDLSVRVSERVAGGELGQLGRSFDEMALQIALREHKLRVSEAEYRVLADNAADIIWRLDADGRIDYISPADERLRGFAPEEVIGLRFEQLLHPEYAAVLERAHALRLEQEKSGTKTGDLTFELPLTCKAGGIIWAEILSTPLRGDHDRIVGYIGVARDITERKKFEAEREQLVADLQEAVAKIRTLSGMLPICAWCKKIRDDKGYWNNLEAYISKHSDVSFSHGICPDCAQKAYEQIEQLEKTTS